MENKVWLSRMFGPELLPLCFWLSDALERWRKEKDLIFELEARLQVRFTAVTGVTYTCFFRAGPRTNPNLVFIYIIFKMNSK